MLYLTCETLLKVNDNAGDKGKSLICRVFTGAEMVFSCVCAEFRIKDVFEVFLTQFVFSVRQKARKIPFKTVLGNLQSLNHGKQH